MNKYLITLKPLGKYFFGGDMTFQIGPEESSEFNETFASYIIASNTFPQQTSLLGMMRYLLLTKSPEVFSLERNKIIRKEYADSLIGRESFHVTDKHSTENNYGKIKSLSPCFLMKENEIFLSAPKDNHLNIVFDENHISAFYNSQALTLPTIKDYNPKEEHPDEYIGLRTNKRYKASEIFTTDVRIGINKDYNGKSNNKGFYKQISYQLKDNFCFAFIANLDFDLKTCQNEIVSLGADGSRFSLSAEEIDNENMYRLIYPEETVKKATSCNKVILLSDSYLDKKDMQQIDFSITDTKPFRFIKTNTGIKDYTVFGEARRIKEKYYLYEKGSVFYFKNKETANTFAKDITNKQEFHQIGYNYCIIL